MRKGLTDFETGVIKKTRTTLEQAYFKRPAGETYIVNEDLRHDWSISEVEYIEQQVNKGEHISKIAKELDADPDEVFLVIFDLARKAKKGKLKVNIKQLAMG